MALPPIYTASSSGGVDLTVVDYKTAFKTALEDGTGTVTIEFDPVPSGMLWRVERITVMCNSSTQTQAVAYAGDPAPHNFVDGTDKGNLDTADESSPITVNSDTVFTVQWTGASAGARATARVQYQLVQRSS